MALSVQTHFYSSIGFCELDQVKSLPSQWSTSIRFSKELALLPEKVA